MQYENIEFGMYELRLNDRMARVWIDGMLTTVHVKNKGSWKKILVSGEYVVMTPYRDAEGEQNFEVFCVRKLRKGWLNLDTQAPQSAMFDWLRKQNFSKVQRGYIYQDTCMDFYMERGQERMLMEVRGCCMERDGIGYFPDSRYNRDYGYLDALIHASRNGYTCYLAYVLQMEYVKEVRTNPRKYRTYARKLEEAKEAGVRILVMESNVTDIEFSIRGCVEGDSQGLLTA